jgi:hypothetical protein
MKEIYRVRISRNGLKVDKLVSAAIVLKVFDLITGATFEDYGTGKNINAPVTWSEKKFDILQSEKDNK